MKLISEKGLTDIKVVLVEWKHTVRYYKQSFKFEDNKYFGSRNSEKWEFFLFILRQDMTWLTEHVGATETRQESESSKGVLMNLITYLELNRWKRTQGSRQFKSNHFLEKFLWLQWWWCIVQKPRFFQSSIDPILQLYDPIWGDFEPPTNSKLGEKRCQRGTVPKRDVQHAGS